MNTNSRWPMALGIALVLAISAIQSVQAASFTVLHRFDFTDGSNPYEPLIQATDGNFYGTTDSGGAGFYDTGTVFKITPTGTLTTLYSFCSQYVGNQCTDGASPSTLVQATDGNFYGTTRFGGAHGKGTVFKITPAGTLTTIYNFTDGEQPEGGVIQATDGNFYGMTYFGGGGDHGTIFRLTPSGTLTTIYVFFNDSTTGAYPEGSLVQATDGSLYGTTSQGSATGGRGSGTVFKITPSGTLTMLYSFCSEINCADGDYPNRTLVQGRDGNFYGTTYAGGGTQYRGTVFKITPEGSFTTVHTFCSESNCSDGAHPRAGLIQATDGALYGTTSEGGIYNKGTLFRIYPSGTFKTLHSFRAAGGKNPYAALLQATDGTLYGTTLIGGTSGNCKGGCGIVFSESIGLGQFVTTQTTSGTVGSAVVILGNNLTGALYVTFNGTAAAYTVVSDSEITTTVPAGATTGFVEVTTSTGSILKSGVKYRVERKTATPVFSLKAGTYTGAQSVTISDATAGASIYYTTDGSTPTLSSSPYEGAITINSTETLNALALGPNDVLSAIKSAHYTIQ